MKKSIDTHLILTLFVIFLSGNLYSQGFKHPGLLHTNTDFERIKAQLAAGEESVVAGYINLTNNEWSQSDVTTWPVETIKRGIAGDENYINAARGAHAAYLNALRWKISGDIAHADRAVFILNSWASVTTALGGNSNVSLASGLYGYEFANAAELMRDYDGWDPDDFKKFQLWMQTVWYPYCYDFLIRRHGTWEAGTPGHYWSNWGLCNVLAVMSIGILCDDEFIYNQGVAFYKYDKVGTYTENRTSPIDNDGLTEFIGNLVPIIHEDARGPFGYVGQMQESGRDQGHATMALGLAVDICQTAWNQGDDLFGYMDNRLLAGLEYVAAYNTGTDDMPWTEYWYHDVRTSYEDSWKQTAPSETARGQFRPYWDRVLGHFEGEKGIILNYAHGMADMVVADDGAYGGTSGGYDHLGFTTLTCTRPAISFGEGPLTLSASILSGGITYNQAELNNVTQGSTIKLIPLLPDTVSNSGNWLWSTGSTSKDLEMTVDSSGIYRVIYTNENGIESTQLFSISMYGDCLPDQYHYTITTDDKMVNDTVLIADQHSRVLLTVASSSWRSNFLWDNDETGGSREVMVEKADTVFSVTGTNMGGAESVINFHIKVNPIGPAYKVGEGDLIYRNRVVVVAGQSVTLMPELKQGIEGGTWNWSSGETTKDLLLENIQQEGEKTVSYSIDGNNYLLTYNIVLVTMENSYSNYPMDEVNGSMVADVWSGLDGEVNSCTTTSIGANNNALFFDGGSTSFTQLPNNITETLNNYTISVWIKPDALDTWSRVWDFGVNTSYNMFFTPKSGDGYARFAIKAGGSEQQITTTSTIQGDMWTHIAVTQSGTTAKLYINGLLAGSNSAMTIHPSDLGYSTQNYLGKSQYDDPMYTGILDELRIYSEALSQTQVVEVMESVKPFYPAYSLDGGELVRDSVVSVMAGQTLELVPTLKPGMVMTGGSWQWSDGSSTQNYLIENIQESTELEVTYTYKGVAIKQGYIINMAQDVTTLYLDNPGFDINCNYTEASGAGNNLAPGNGAVEVIEGWQRIQNGEWAAASTYEFGYLGTFNGVGIPSSGYNGDLGDGAGALGLSAGWTASVIYYQDISLPAGTYQLTYHAYNANIAATKGECLVAWVPNNGVSVMSSKTDFTSGVWEAETLSFTVEEETSGKIQVGMQSENAGTGDHAKLFFDYVNLKQFDDTQTGIVAEGKNGTGVNIYPTVSSGNFILRTSGESALVTIYNLAGNIVQQWTNSDTEAEFTLPKPQMYIVKVSTISASEIFKIIKK
nr:LamG-like jellyroll fold domain-containing protein [uncultured Carboxylicivirga sp.]